mmetsp:Transcript_11173/g.24659  ORF Transcript_11173/g.24659 Transcript_11173/m.24659 type:complete len:246 (+) Transcript_11173:264-1001(+)
MRGSSAWSLEVVEGLAAALQMMQRQSPPQGPACREPLQGAHLRGCHTLHRPSSTTTALQLRGPRDHSGLALHRPATNRERRRQARRARKRTRVQAWRNSARCASGRCKSSTDLVPLNKTKRVTTHRLTKPPTARLQQERYTKGLHLLPRSHLIRHHRRQALVELGRCPLLHPRSTCTFPTLRRHGALHRRRHPCTQISVRRLNAPMTPLMVGCRALQRTRWASRAPASTPLAASSLGARTFRPTT